MFYVIFLIKKSRYKSVYETYIHISVLILIYLNWGLALSWDMTLLSLLPFLAATTELKLSSQPQILVDFVNLFFSPQYIFLLCTFCISEYYYFYYVLGMSLSQDIILSVLLL